MEGEPQALLFLLRRRPIALGPLPNRAGVLNPADIGDQSRPEEVTQLVGDGWERTADRSLVGIEVGLGRVAGIAFYERID